MMNMDRGMGGTGGMNNMDRGMSGGGMGRDGMGGMDRGMGRDMAGGQGGPHARSRSASRYQPGQGGGRTGASGPGYHSLDRDRDGYGAERDRDFMPIDRPTDRPRDRSLDR